MSAGETRWARNPVSLWPFQQIINKTGHPLITASPRNTASRSKKSHIPYKAGVLSFRFPIQCLNAILRQYRQSGIVVKKLLCGRHYQEPSGNDFLLFAISKTECIIRTPRENPLSLQLETLCIDTTVNLWTLNLNGFKRIGLSLSAVRWCPPTSMPLPHKNSEGGSRSFLREPSVLRRFHEVLCYIDLRKVFTDTSLVNIILLANNGFFSRASYCYGIWHWMISTKNSPTGVKKQWST